MQFEEAEKHMDDKPVERNVGGRPHSLECNAETLKQINTLARMQCTKKEAAAVLGVHRDTLATFFGQHEKANEAWEDGLETGKVSLRRAQYKNATEGNVTMQIWLGKQWLDQKDKAENTLQGPDGGPVQLGVLLGKLTQAVCPLDEADDDSST
jgi:hypothetical protein